MNRVNATELQRYQAMGLEAVLPLLAEYAKDDVSFQPIQIKLVSRWNVTVSGRHFELVLNGPKFYDSRAKSGGGSVIDLTMHLFQLNFKRAVEKFRAIL
ncbi:hypothetical protein DFR42_101506 [Undibacterium pigrum]|uniref:Uncharacterized protein n=1 Tax=Undibacterium pigrum TaxID=401470 RepID=A0A318JRF7_9BURK|nr:hypothetical protein DFR42_101506 [Undibacterium pigrum]